MAKKRSADTKELLTIPELCDVLGLRPTRVKELLKELPSGLRSVGKTRQRVVPREAAEALLAKRAAAQEVSIDSVPATTAGKPPTPLEQAVLTFLKKSKRRKWASTFAELVEAVDRSPAKVQKAIESLRDRGMNIVLGADEGAETRVGLSGDFPPGFGSEQQVIIHTSKFWNNKWYEFGLCGDAHLGSKHFRKDAIEAYYSMLAEEGVTEVYNTGNMLEGENSRNFHDIAVFTLDGQVNYWIDNFPQRKSITTYFVTGDDHEGWYQQREGMEIGRYMQQCAEKAGRNDLKYIGYVEHDVVLKAQNGERIMKVMHPGGGSAYALSYSAQKLIESFQGGEKPAVFAYGHYHKYDTNFYREVYNIGTGCFVDQSIFMRKNKLQAHVGGVRVKLNQAPDGQITRCMVEFMSFYNRGYYTKPRKF